MKILSVLCLVLCVCFVGMAQLAWPHFLVMGDSKNIEEIQ